MKRFRAQIRFAGIFTAIMALIHIIIGLNIKENWELHQGISVLATAMLFTGFTIGMVYCEYTIRKYMP